jgi:hypothetical protein
MKRVITGVLIASCTVLLTGLALGQTTTGQTAKHITVSGEEYHHLLMLDVREAVQHAKVLHEYATLHAKHLDKAVMTKHVDEITKNLEGVRTELTDVEQNVNALEKTTVEGQLSTIRTDQQKALADLDVLKAEVAKDAPNAGVIAAKSKAIYLEMTSANQHHHKVMVQRGVHEPSEPKP